MRVAITFAALTRDHRPHPAKGYLAVAEIRNTQIAATLGVDQATVSKMLNGRVPASDRLRALVAQVLEMPERELFHD
jgi:transcriptional regulator with XRE-family HTH domain